MGSHTPIPGKVSWQQTLRSLLLRRDVLITLLLTLGILPALLLYGGYYIVGDGTLQELAFIHEAKKMLSSSDPWWSWNTYIGDNYIGAYSYYVFINPFALVNCLFPWQYIGVGYTLMLYCKFLVCGYVTDRYLRLMGFGKELALLGTVLFTFSSYAICCQLYYFFMEPMIMFVVLLICVERLLRGRRYGMTWVAVATAGVCMSNFYFAPGTLMVSALYFLCRIFAGERSLRWPLLWRGVLSVMLGVVLSAVLLLPEALFLSGSDRITEGDPIIWANIPWRILTIFFPTFVEGRSPFAMVHSAWDSNHANIAVFGVLAAALYLRHAPRAWLSVWLLICLVCYITPLNGIFLGFTSFQYSRWSYALIMAIVLATLTYMRDGRSLTTRQALWYGGLCVALYCVFGGATWYIDVVRVHLPWGAEQLTLLVYLLLILANCGALLWASRSGFPGRSYGTGMLLVSGCVVLQLLAFTVRQTDNTFLTIPSMRAASRYWVGRPITSPHDEIFVSRTDFRTRSQASYVYMNMATLCNKASVSSYNSLKDPRYAELFEAVTADGAYMRTMFAPTRSRTSFDALMSVSQVVDFRDTLCVEAPVEGLTLLTSAPRYDVYTFRHYIPMGYVYDRYMPYRQVRAAMDADSVSDVPLAMLAALSVREEDEAALSPYLERVDYNADIDLDSVVAERRRLVCTDFRGDTRGFSADIALPEPKVVFFSVISDPGFKATIDGEPTQIYNVNLGLSAIVVPEGTHHIVFDYFPSGLRTGALISAFALAVLLALALYERRRQKSALSSRP